MFSEYCEQITQLRAKYRHFSRIFDAHNKLDDEIKQLQDTRSPAYQSDIEDLKKQKLVLKQEIYSLLRKAEIRAA